MNIPKIIKGLKKDLTIAGIRRAREVVEQRPACS